jgi:hypothetical protein
MHVTCEGFSELHPEESRLVAGGDSLGDWARAAAETELKMILHPEQAIQDAITYWW